MSTLSAQPHPPIVKGFGGQLCGKTPDHVLIRTRQTWWNLFGGIGIGRQMYRLDWADLADRADSTLVIITWTATRSKCISSRAAGPQFL